jgi:holin-like protein
LLNHLSLLFVPAGVGVVLHMNLIADEWLPISAALIGSTVLAIAVSALIIVWLTRLTGDRPTGEAYKDDSERGH